MFRRLAFVLALYLVLGACGKEAGLGRPGRAANTQAEATESIRAADILARVGVLAADEFEGRGPDSAGGKKTTAWLIDQLKAMGLEPGNNGSWRQQVPLRSIHCDNIQTVLVSGDERRELVLGRDYVAKNRRPDGLHRARGELVFVGHGVQAPEYDWDDFAGLDCRGKILVMLVGDPPCSDQSLFAGPAMTYYGRWTYKFDKARELGAEGCIVVHKTPWAGYGWSVVSNSWSRDKTAVIEEDASSHTAFEGWVTWEVAESLVTGTGRSLDDLAAAAARRGFAPVPLGVSLDAVIKTSTTEIADENVVARARGNDPYRQKEHVVVTAHWDHLGKGQGQPGEDVIYNGAVDNASGCAVVLELAEAVASLKGRHPRSALFLFVCSEEQGLLGSAYYAANPIVPARDTVANINVDGANLWDRTDDVEVIGWGQSQLDGILTGILEADGRHARPDTEPEKGLYYRSDHFNFARIGIPALYVKGGVVVPDKPEGWLKEKKAAWVRNDYHRVSDELRPDMKATGAEADARALFGVLTKLLDSELWPAWSEASEFRAVSEKDRGRP
ncbi:MAG: M20/M25/M40 family metallo-hydrolase [Planctomycetes bacterium]|nr:M20/M25/M40 family metallo-hydrolase [Planctomycetota bacterium]